MESSPFVLRWVFITVTPPCLKTVLTAKAQNAFIHNIANRESAKWKDVKAYREVLVVGNAPPHEHGAEHKREERHLRVAVDLRLAIRRQQQLLAPHERLERLKARHAVPACQLATL